MARNTHGQVLPDLRMNIVNPTLATAQALEPVKQQLRKQGAAMTPDFGELSEIINDKDFYDADKAGYLSQLNSLQQEFLTKGFTDPLNMFGQEAKDLIARINRFKNNATTAKQERIYADALLQRDIAKKAGIMDKPWVRDGIIQYGPDGKPLRVQDAWRTYHKYGGLADYSSIGMPDEFVVDQTNDSDAMMWVTDFLKKAETSGSTQFKDRGDVLETINSVNNVGQLEDLMGTLFATTPEGQDFLVNSSKQINGLIADAASRVYHPSMSRSELQRAANQEAINTIKRIANGVTNIKSTRSLKEDPSFSASMRRAQFEDVNVSPFYANIVDPQDIVQMKSGDTEFTTTGTVMKGSWLTDVYGKDGSAMYLNNSAIQWSKHAQNVFVTNATDGKNLDFQSKHKFNSSSQGQQEKHQILSNTLIDPEGDVTLFFALEGPDGDPIINEAMEKYGVELERAAERRRNAPATPQSWKAYQDEVHRIQREASQEMNQNLQIYMSVTGIYGEDARNYLGSDGLFSFDRTDVDDAFLEGRKETDQGMDSYYAQLFQNAGREDFDEHDDYYKINLVSKIENDFRNYATMDYRAGQGNKPAQMDRRMGGAMGNSVIITNDTAPAPGTSEM